ncbi:hypothetical protein BGX27_009040 [Mortierella sp. AM989]|nr:hypothetical protein BGX27_009040 [Mortierella sp. AM989]
MKNSQGDTLRIHLAKSRTFVGIRSTRCQREYNQDRYKVVVLNPPTLSPARASTSASSSSTSRGNGSQHTANSTEGAQMDADQKTLFYFAIFDGHGGSNTSDFLTAHLDAYIDEAKPEMVPDIVKDFRKLGGYFRSFRPHFLESFLPPDFEDKYGGKQPSQQRKVQIKGKGGRIRPMVFIPHPNASEEDQNEAVEFLEKQGAGRNAGSSSESKSVSSQAVDEPVDPTEETDMKNDQRENLFRKDEENRKQKSETSKDEDEEAYDMDEDPHVIARRKYLNRTSPLPGGTTAYSGSHRSEYENLVIRERCPDEENENKEKPEMSMPSTMTLEQRLFLAYLRCDAELVRDKYRDGSTASTVVVRSKGAFWETQDDLDLVIAHVGDTRILLCEAPHGECIQLTTDHHPDATVETERIRKMAAYVTSDSFGENMFLGRVANTRALGDITTKSYGVTAEPEIVQRTIKAKEAAFLVLVSDGITGVMSNQEIVDTVKLEKDPMQAAANVLNLAEQLGAEDNCTAMVVRLPAWGTKMPDLSRELREYRWQSEAQQSRARRR